MAMRIFLSTAGMAISKLGKSATSGNIDDLSFSMGRINTRRASINGSGTVSTGSSGSASLKEQSVAHGLGFVPVFHVDSVSNSNGNLVLFSVDATNIYYYTAGANTIRYTLFDTQWV